MRAVVITAVGHAKVLNVSDNIGSTLVVPLPTPPLFARPEETGPPSISDFPQAILKRVTIHDPAHGGDIPVFYPSGWPAQWGEAEYLAWRKRESA